MQIAHKTTNMVEFKDIRNCFMGILAGAAGGVCIGQAGYPHERINNELGVLACGLVFLAYVTHLIGILEWFPSFDSTGVNLAMFCHGFQACYYHYNALTPALALPPFILGVLFIVYIVICGIEKRLPRLIAEPDIDMSDESEFV